MADAILLEHLCKRPAGTADRDLVTSLSLHTGKVHGNMHIAISIAAVFGDVDDMKLLTAVKGGRHPCLNGSSNRLVSQIVLQVFQSTCSITPYTIGQYTNLLTCGGVYRDLLWQRLLIAKTRREPLGLTRSAFSIFTPKSMRLEKNPTLNQKRGVPLSWASLTSVAQIADIYHRAILVIILK
jgi:hypothetical protein